MDEQGSGSYCILYPQCEWTLTKRHGWTGVWELLYTLPTVWINLDKKAWMNRGLGVTVHFTHSVNQPWQKGMDEQGSGSYCILYPQCESTLTKRHGWTGVWELLYTLPTVWMNLDKKAWMNRGLGVTVHFTHSVNEPWQKGMDEQGSGSYCILYPQCEWTLTKRHGWTGVWELLYTLPTVWMNLDKKAWMNRGLGVTVYFTHSVNEPWQKGMDEQGSGSYCILYPQCEWTLTKRHGWTGVWELLYTLPTVWMNLDKKAWMNRGLGVTVYFTHSVNEPWQKGMDEQGSGSYCILYPQCEWTLTKRHGWTGVWELLYTLPTVWMNLDKKAWMNRGLGVTVYFTHSVNEPWQKGMDEQGSGSYCILYPQCEWTLTKRHGWTGVWELLYTLPTVWMNLDKKAWMNRGLGVTVYFTHSVNEPWQKGMDEQGSGSYCILYPQCEWTLTKRHGWTGVWELLYTLPTVWMNLDKKAWMNRGLGVTVYFTHSVNEPWQKGMDEQGSGSYCILYPQCEWTLTKRHGWTGVWELLYTLPTVWMNLDKKAWMNRGLGVTVYFTHSVNEPWQKGMDEQGSGSYCILYPQCEWTLTKRHGWTGVWELLYTLPTVWMNLDKKAWMNRGLGVTVYFTHSVNEPWQKGMDEQGSGSYCILYPQCEWTLTKRHGWTGVWELLYTLPTVWMNLDKKAWMNRGLGVTVYFTHSVNEPWQKGMDEQGSGSYCILYPQCEWTLTKRHGWTGVWELLYTLPTVWMNLDKKAWMNRGLGVTVYFTHSVNEPWQKGMDEQGSGSYCILYPQCEWTLTKRHGWTGVWELLYTLPTVWMNLDKKAWMNRGLGVTVYFTHSVNEPWQKGMDEQGSGSYCILYPQCEWTLTKRHGWTGVWELLYTLPTVWMNLDKKAWMNRGLGVTVYFTHSVNEPWQKGMDEQGSGSYCILYPQCEWTLTKRHGWTGVWELLYTLPTVWMNLDKKAWMNRGLGVTVYFTHSVNEPWQKGMDEQGSGSYCILYPQCEWTLTKRHGWTGVWELLYTLPTVWMNLDKKAWMNRGLGVTVYFTHSVNQPWQKGMDEQGSGSYCILYPQCESTLTKRHGWTGVWELLYTLPTVWMNLDKKAWMNRGLGVTVYFTHSVNEPWQKGMDEQGSGSYCILYPQCEWTLTKRHGWTGVWELLYTLPTVWMNLDKKAWMNRGLGVTVYFTHSVNEPWQKGMDEQGSGSYCILYPQCEWTLTKRHGWTGVWELLYTLPTVWMNLDKKAWMNRGLGVTVYFTHSVNEPWQKGMDEQGSGSYCILYPQCEWTLTKRHGWTGVWELLYTLPTVWMNLDKKAWMNRGLGVTVYFTHSVNEPWQKGMDEQGSGSYCILYPQCEWTLTKRHGWTGVWELLYTLPTVWMNLDKKAWMNRGLGVTVYFTHSVNEPWQKGMDEQGSGSYCTLYPQCEWTLTKRHGWTGVWELLYTLPTVWMNLDKKAWMNRGLGVTVYFTHSVNEFWQKGKNG